MPLFLLQRGQSGIVVDVQGGKCVWDKLAGMGLVKGATVNMVKNDGCGAMIIGLGTGRLVLGRGISRKIIIEQA